MYLNLKKINKIDLFKLRLTLTLDVFKLINSTTKEIKIIRLTLTLDVFK